MTELELKAKTKTIALNVGRMAEKLPANKVNNTYVGQILRSSASIGANYRAACRAKSTRDFIHKLQIVEEETDETMYFLELLAAFNEKNKAEMRAIYKETEIVLKIIVASIKTSKKKLEDAVKSNQKTKIQNIK